MVARRNITIDDEIDEAIAAFADLKGRLPYSAAVRQLVLPELERAGLWPPKKVQR